MMKNIRNEPKKGFLLVLAYIILVMEGYLLDKITGGHLFIVAGFIGGAGIFILLYPKRAKHEKTSERSWPIIEVSVGDVRKAVRSFSEQLPKGVYRTILLKDDNSIDFEQLAPYLNGIPSQNYYMSRETYDIFSENEKDIAAALDKVQKAVDLYVKEHKQYPVIQFDPLNRVNYFQLLQARCLDEQPEMDLYLTKYDGLVTHIKPRKNSTGFD